MFISKIISAIRGVRQRMSAARNELVQQQRIFAGIEKVVLSDSEQELEEVLKHYPELLEMETIKMIGSMGVRAKNAGHPEDAEVLGVAFMRLMTFGKDAEARSKVSKIASNVDWAIKARRYLSLRERALLEEAIAAAEQFPDIARFLKLFDDENISEYRPLGETLIQQLRQEGRDEEAFTVELINLHQFAVTLEKIDEATLEQKELVTNVGLHDCQEAMKIARILNDNSCQAFYTGVLALFFWKSNLVSPANYYFNQVLQMYRELAQKEPRSFSGFLAITLNNLGNTKVQFQQYVEAKALFEEAVQIYRDLAAQEPDIFTDDVARTLIGLGSVQSIIGDLTGSERSFAEALKIFRSLAQGGAKIYGEMIATTLNNLTNTQRNLYKLADAENSISEALRIYRELAEQEPAFFAKDIVLALVNLGSVQRSKGNLVEAENSLNEALKMCRVLVGQEPTVHKQTLVMILTNLGAIQEERGEFEDAEQSLNEALEIQESSVQPTLRNFNKELAIMFDNLGNLQRANGKPLGAEQSYAQALQIRRNLAEQDPDIFNRDLVQTLRNLGYFRLEQNDLFEARDFFGEAKDLIENLREKAITIDERHRVMRENNNLYLGLLECYIKLKDWKKALETAELGKSRSLSDLLNLKSEAFRPKAPTPDVSAYVERLGEDYSAAIKELQQLESHERFLSERLGQDDGSRMKQFLEQEKQKVQEQRFAKHSDLERALAQIKNYDQDFPPRAKVINTEGIFEISKNLNRAIVMFRFLGESTAVFFVFPTGELHVEEIKGFGRMKMFELFRDGWYVPYQLSTNGEKEFKRWKNTIERTLDTIYERLIIHVRQILKEKCGVREILFVPNQSLALLPLHATSWEDANGKKRYLLEEYTISYVPSVSVFKRCLENEKQRSNKTLLVTNPEGDLEFSEQEASYIETLHQQGENLSGKDATKSAVIDALREDYGFTHFACHGFYSQETPFDSYLKMFDGKLKLSEIINCNLRGNWLTTLSACETGMVDIQWPTDEHFGFPLGFIFAGSPSVWASLWAVDDQATSDLMRKAYENLSNEEYTHNKPEALRQAQLSMLRDLPHPFYWAGFQHVGI